MKSIPIKQSMLHLNENVVLKGWVETIRDFKNHTFLILKDRTGLIQAFFDSNAKESFSEVLSQLTLQSTLEVSGLVKENANVKNGGIEIIPSNLRILSIAEKNIPVDQNSQQSQRMDWRFIDLRSSKNILIFEIQTRIEQLMRQFWEKADFIEIHSPKLMGSPSESGAELFEVEYFETKAYLAQSPQFFKQMAMAAGFERIFEIGPVFRANPSFTSRHDTEFTSVDIEISWIDSHEDVMVLEETWLNFILSGLKESHGEIVKEIFGQEIFVPRLPFPRISMDEAHRTLKDLGHVIPAEYEGDLDPEGEKKLCNHVKETLDHEFVFITDYPATVRPFYHMRHEDDKTKTKSFDLLWKGLEVTSGAQREHRYEELRSQAIEKGLEIEKVSFYLDFFKYGCPPHGGYGFGLSRMLMLVLGLGNVRDVTYLYRGPNRLTP